MSKLKKSTPFVVHLVLPIDDVQRQIQEKTTVISAGFKCEDDPTPREFTLKADFGSSTADFLSFSWRCKSELKGLTSVFNQLSIVDQDGSLLIADKDRGTLALNSITARKMAILLHLQYVPDDSIPDPASDSTTQFQWQRDFLAKFESGDDTDFTFIVKGEEVAAHKLILSTRSAYFQQMIDAGMQESASNRVVVPDMEPATFKQMLRFCYGGVMEEKEFESLAPLIVAADKYGMDELKKMCELAIRSNLLAKNIIDALILADMINCPALLRDAKVLFKALARYLKKDQTNWKKLEKRPSLLLSLVDFLTE